MIGNGFLPCVGVATQLLTGLKEQGRFQEVQIIHSEMSIKGLDCLSANEDDCAVVNLQIELR